MAGTEIHADSSLVDANASLNSVRELDAGTLAQIQRTCREQTEKLDETDAHKDEKNDDQDPDLPPPGPRTEINKPPWCVSMDSKLGPGTKTTGRSMTSTESLRR